MQDQQETTKVIKRKRGRPRLKPRVRISIRVPVSDIDALGCDRAEVRSLLKRMIKEEASKRA